MEKPLSVKEKSLKINIDSNFFGTIAEIGGGQETARNLFQAGGASNSIAKTISAYDKKYSDYFYNNGQKARYVAKERLEKMLACEYAELLDVASEKDAEKNLYAFANTVEVLNYHKTNRGHGWLGIAFEGSNSKEPNVIYIHVQLKENDALLQQYTVGAIGINLIYGAAFKKSDYRALIHNLLDNLDTFRLDVDYIYVNGPDFKDVDNRLLNLMLVSEGMTAAIMFDTEGNVQQPSDMLYKKNVLAIRGVFRPINNLGMDIVQKSHDKFKVDKNYSEDNTITFCEITLSNLMKDEKLDEKDFLDRVDLLNAMGQCVMISRFVRYFSLAEYFAQFRLKRLRLVIGTPTFIKLMDKSYYTDLRGGLLEAMGRMIDPITKIYIYPSIDHETGNIIYPNDLNLEDDVQHLLNYLQMNRRIVKLNKASAEYQKITTDLVLEHIETASDELQSLLPEKVLELVKAKQLFGYGSKKEVQPTR